MRFRLPPLIACAVVGGCGQPAEEHRSGPPSRMVGVLESVLPRFPCIGNIHHWQRIWRFEQHTLPRRDWSTTTIEFGLRRAGRFGILPTRRIEAPLSPGVVEWFFWENPKVDQAFGTYDIPSRTLKLTSCAPPKPGAAGHSQ
jgi:hypothetical protein